MKILFKLITLPLFILAFPLAVFCSILESQGNTELFIMAFEEWTDFFMITGV